jgi:hypothetical protein
MCGKPGKGRHGTSHHAKAIYQIISSSRSWDMLRKCERTDGQTDGRTRWLQYSPHSMSEGIIKSGLLIMVGLQSFTKLNNRESGSKDK